MRRAEFLRLTGLTAIRFNALVHKGVVGRGHMEGMERGWREFSLLDVLLTGLTLDLARSGGTQVQAATLVKTEAYRLFEGGVSLSQLAGRETWLGYARVGEEQFNSEEGRFEQYASTRPLAGRLSDIKRDIERFSTSKNGQSVFSVVLLNASQTLRRLIARARHFELENGIAADLAEVIVVAHDDEQR